MIASTNREKIMRYFKIVTIAENGGVEVLRMSSEMLPIDALKNGLARLIKQQGTVEFAHDTIVPDDEEVEVMMSDILSTLVIKDNVYTMRDEGGVIVFMETVR